jgi:hypothetical protein
MLPRYRNYIFIVQGFRPLTQLMLCAQQHANKALASFAGSAGVTGHFHGSMHVGVCRPQLMGVIPGADAFPQEWLENCMAEVGRDML